MPNAEPAMDLECVQGVHAPPKFWATKLLFAISIDY